MLLFNKLINNLHDIMSHLQPQTRQVTVHIHMRGDDGRSRFTQFQFESIPHVVRAVRIVASCTKTISFMRLVVAAAVTHLNRMFPYIY